MSWRVRGSEVEAIIEAHRAAGRRFTAAGVGSFVRDEGDGEPVVCMHGVPASSFLYRKLLVELAGRGLRGVAFDLPGLGLADRPTDFDYSYSGLGRSPSPRSTRSGWTGSTWWCTMSGVRSASRSPPRYPRGCGR